jgi:hypothetical protein
MLMAAVNVKAEEPQQAQGMDSVVISLITCSPHEEVYSLYGHTALRYQNLRTGQDIVFNYGVFNFAAPHFVLRFVFGLTDYELGVGDFGAFCSYYKRWGSSVTEQVLNLTDNEKQRITQALAINLLPENRIYRYNFFYDNCSTRPRDIIEHNVEGTVVYEEPSGQQPTYRQMIHEKTSHHPWATLGNDLLLGVKADLETTRREQQFLPDNLMHDFSKAFIVTAGKSRPLVKEQRVILPAGQQKVEKEFPLPPIVCMAILAAVFAIVLAVEHRRGKCIAAFDAAWMLLAGLAGIILFTMLFSEHPTTSTNLQILMLNPLHLFFIRSVWKHSRTTRYWNLLLICTCLFFIGRIWQDYAEGMEILALCLLSRYWSHRKNIP